MTEILDPSAMKLNAIERKRHLLTIERLTEQIGISKIEISKLYEAELIQVFESSRIRDFLPILIARRVTQDVRRMQAATIS